MRGDAIFRVYSMTKPFVSVAAMILVEEGRLQLADPVSRWLPDFRDVKVSVRRADAAGGGSWELVPAERAITVHDLLRHTSGLTYGTRTDNQPVRDAYVASRLVDWRMLSPAEQVSALARAPLAWQPGTRFEYGLSTDLLGRVVEAVTGMRLRDFLEARLFRPLGMVDTGFVVPPGKRGRIAEPLPDAPDVPFDVTVEPGNDAGGGGAVSTTMDYIRFAQMLLDGGKLGGARILSRTSVELMTSDHLGSRVLAASPSAGFLGVEGYGFGLGFLVRKEAGIAAVPGSAGEFMWGGLFGTFFWVDPRERIVAVVMTQASGPQRTAYRRLWKQLVHQAIVD
jgi:CubicO group peptidase (beta-lactamase class C family)